jgi:hypothetical protein
MNHGGELGFAKSNEPVRNGCPLLSWSAGSAQAVKFFKQRNFRWYNPIISFLLALVKDDADIQRRMWALGSGWVQHLVFALQCWTADELLKVNGLSRLQYAVIASGSAVSTWAAVWSRRDLQPAWNGQTWLVDSVFHRAYTHDLLACRRSLLLAPSDKTWFPLQIFKRL